MSKHTPEKLRKIVRDYVTKSWNFDPVTNYTHNIDHQSESNKDRTVPVHSFLIDYEGLHLETNSKQPHARLFAVLKRFNNRWGRDAGLDFAAFKKKCICPLPWPEKPAWIRAIQDET